MRKTLTILLFIVLCSLMNSHKVDAQPVAGIGKGGGNGGGGGGTSPGIKPPSGDAVEFGRTDSGDNGPSWFCEEDFMPCDLGPEDPNTGARPWKGVADWCIAKPEGGGYSTSTECENDCDNTCHEK